LPLEISQEPVQLKKIPVHCKTTADPDRIYMDGCFDLMHSGHFNAIRQAKALGKTLVVGVHSDAEIARNKGPPVMNEQERYALARSCKWVDEVIEDAPYSPTITLLDSFNCMYAAHGDDLSINENGDDCMSILKRAGRCKIFKRTEGISTTQIVGKLLLMTKEAWCNVSTPLKSNELIDQEVEKTSSGHKKNLLTTSRRISEFSNKKEPKPTDTIVYMDGTFDLFHIGHVETMRRAKEMGDFLIVGVHDDQTVNYYKGSNFPIMSLHDRVMCVLSTKWVDEVIIGAPWNITKQLITGFNIKIIVQGTVHKGDPEAKKWRKGSVDVDEDPYEVAKEMGIYREIESVNKLDTQDIINRIVENRVNYFSKFQVSTQREKKYDDTKVFVQEV
jgi:ethanolamine-phosphate cytidylyltransferase